MSPTTVDMLDQPSGCLPAQLDDVLAELRRIGFGSSRPAYVTYQVGAATWEQALAINNDARRDGCQGSVFMDRGRWVVRLVWHATPTRAFIDRKCRYVENLAGRYGGATLTFSVEDTVRDDCWVELAVRVLSLSSLAEEVEGTEQERHASLR